MPEPGSLYVVATPIGNLDDISQRALKTLGMVAVIAAEDTRHSGRLLAHFGIRTPQLSLHDHNEAQRSEQIIKRLQSGDDVALISDAGTPLISDPGYTLVSQVRACGLTVSPIPGPSAVIAALSAAGLPTDRFAFEGFLPAKAGPREQRLKALVPESRTMVFYLSRHQATRQLEEMAATFGAGRAAVLAREISKLHETFLHGTLAGLLESWVAKPSQHKGELVLVVGGAPSVTMEEGDLENLLTILLEEMGPKQAASLAVKICGCARNQAYRLALKLQPSKE